MPWEIHSCLWLCSWRLVGSAQWLDVVEFCNWEDSLADEGLKCWYMVECCYNRSCYVFGCCWWIELRHRRSQASSLPRAPLLHLFVVLSGPPSVYIAFLSIFFIEIGLWCYFYFILIRVFIIEFFCWNKFEGNEVIISSSWNFFIFFVETREWKKKMTCFSSFLVLLFLLHKLENSIFSWLL